MKSRGIQRPWVPVRWKNLSKRELSERYESIWDFEQKFDISVELKMPGLRSHDFYGLDYQKSDRIIRRLPWILEVEEDK